MPNTSTKPAKAKNVKTASNKKKFRITHELRKVGLDRLASELLVNGYNAPIPHKMLNQRQRRKYARQAA